MVTKKVKQVQESNDIHVMVDFTAITLKLCYDKLALYPEIQNDISELIKKLAQI